MKSRFFPKLFAFSKNKRLLCKNFDPERNEKKMKERIKELLVRQKRYRDCDYSQAQLAADMGVDVSQLSRSFKRLFGMSYSGLVHKYRVKDAMKYLRNPKQHYTIDDVAMLAGFGNRQSFYSAFKKETGMTPEAWRTYQLTSLDKTTD